MTSSSATVERAGTSGDLAKILTLVMFVFYASAPEFPFMVVAPLSVAVVIGGLIWPQLRGSWLFWGYVSVAVVLARLPDFLVIDNHHYLIAYWCIAVFCCSLAARDDPDGALARNARLLIGLAMAFAVLAKLRSGEFANGDFFEFLLLSGERFRFFSEIVAGVPAETLQANQRALASLKVSGVLSSTLVNEASFAGQERVWLLADLLSIWTLAIEGACAALFLWPRAPGWVRVSRNAALVVFALTTYAVATVGAFGWILMILGVAQCDGEDRVDRRARFAYCAVLLLILVYTLPFGAWLASGIR